MNDPYNVDENIKYCEHENRKDKKYQGGSRTYLLNQMENFLKQQILRSFSQIVIRKYDFRSFYNLNLQILLLVIVLI